LLKKLDPYQHPRSTGRWRLRRRCLEDGWMDYITYRSSNDQLGAVEHQLYGAPAVNVGASDDAGDPDTFRRRLWNATMNGQYPSFSSSESTAPSWPSGTNFSPPRVTGTSSRSSTWMAADGLALEEVEYIVYVEKAGQVEVAVEKHGYDVAWFNPVKRRNSSSRRRISKAKNFSASARPHA